MLARFALLAIASLAGTAHAVTVTWNINGPDNQWTNRNNWIGGRIPGPGDFVVIPAGGNPSVQNTAVFIEGMYVQPGANLLIFTTFIVEGGASIQGNMSIVSGRFLHRDDINLEGQLMLWGGAQIARRPSGSGVFTVRQNGSILLRSDNTQPVRLATAMQVQGLLDNQSAQPLLLGKTSSDESDGTYLSIETGASARFSRSCLVQATTFAGQSQPYIVNAGDFIVEGPSSNVVDIADNLPVFNAGVVYVNAPDLHIRSSWDFNTNNGTLTRGNWACQNLGRIFFDNNTLNTVGRDARIHLFGPGSQILQLQQAGSNEGFINIDFGATLSVFPASGVFVNHGAMNIGSSSRFGAGDQFANAVDGTLTLWLAGAGDFTHASVNCTSAVLAGTLNAPVEVSYVPGPGDHPTLVQALSNVFGSFDTVNVLYTSVPAAMNYQTHAADLVFGAALCPADFNGDGFLDFFDYDDFVKCFETTDCPQNKTADFNGDQFVDFFDYDDFVAAFETGC